MIAAVGQGARRYCCVRDWRCDERCTRQAANVRRFKLRSISAGALGPLPALVPKLLTVSVLSCAMAVAGCARNPAPHEVAAEPIRSAAPARAYPELRIRRPARALLASQPAPDCEFRGPDRNTVDPVEWARLKLDYERQCYQRAEKIARDRLRQLQASSRCEVQPVRHSQVR
jgi:hypothetical protein